MASHARELIVQGGESFSIRVFRYSRGDALRPGRRKEHDAGCISRDRIGEQQARDSRAIVRCEPGPLGPARGRRPIGGEMFKQARENLLDGRVRHYQLRPSGRKCAHVAIESIWQVSGK